MKKRLLVLLVAVILLIGMTATVYADFVSVEWNLYKNLGATTDTSLYIRPIENNTSSVKFRFLGDFTGVDDTHPMSVGMYVFENDTLVYRIDYTWRGGLTNFVDATIPYMDYHAGSEYYFRIVMIGSYTEVSNLLCYVSDLSLVGGSYDDGYSDGYDDAMNTSNALGSAFEGFFVGMASFMDTFMDVGIGAVTIRNMVGLCVIAVLVMCVIKVVRG